MSSTDGSASFTSRLLSQGRGWTIGCLMTQGSDDDDQELIFLYVEREERHTVDSLHVRNQELYRFAEEHGIETCDGMDVGPVTTGNA